MKRWLAFTAVTLIASVSFTTPSASAQAAPPDPAQVLKRQFRPEHGVHITEVSRITIGDGEPLRMRLKSRVQLGTSGPVAMDGTLQIVLDAKTKAALERDGVPIPDDIDTELQVSVVGGSLYYSGSFITPLLPAGKTWVRDEPSEDTKITPAVVSRLASQQTINVFEPAVLRAVLKGSTAKPVPGGFVYRGTVTGAELTKASRSTYARQSPKQKINWQLWTDADGRLQRLQTNESMGKGEYGVSEGTDTRYSAWGSELIVIAPPADQVIDAKDLPRDLPMAREVLEEALA